MSGREGLNAQEQFVLDWLAGSDTSALGECHGFALDRLVALGLAEIVDTGQADRMFHRVRLTDDGKLNAKPERVSWRAP